MEEVVGEVGEGAAARVAGEVAHEAKLGAVAGTDAAGAEGGRRVVRGARVVQGAKVVRGAGAGAGVTVTVTARKKVVQRVGRENLEVAAANGVIIKKMGRKRRKVPVQCMLVNRPTVHQLEE